MHRIARSLRRLSPPALALPLAAIAMAVVVHAASEAADLHQWAAGEAATVATPASLPHGQAVGARAAAFERILGLAGAAGRRMAVVDDRFHGRTVDEVTYLDGRGRPIGLVRLGPDGRLSSAVRLGYREVFAAGTVSAAQAAERAAALIAELGLELPAQGPLTRPTMNGTLWTVTWPRTVDGIQVDGDGLTVRIWRSGDLHSVTVTERPIAKPATMISAAEARAALDAALALILTGERRSDGTMTEMGLRWVAANDRYRPEGADAPASVLRLAYVYEMRFGGPSAELIRAATFWIDAETGDLIGGDILR